MSSSSGQVRHYNSFSPLPAMVWELQIVKEDLSICTLSGAWYKAFWVNGVWLQVTYPLLLGSLSSSELKYDQLTCYLSTFSGLNMVRRMWNAWWARV